MANNPEQGEGGLLEEALKDLEHAEDHLAHAREDELAAAHEVEEAIEDIKEAEHDDREIVVHVVHVNEAEKASFKENVERTLQVVWDRSYTELKIAREPKDVFQTGGDHPKSLMNHLGLTLDAAREQKVITDFRFGIASETGGA
jgi:hypothetical protein